MMASSRGRDRSSPWDGRGFGRIGCLFHQAEEHAIMNRAETEDGSYASGRNRKLLAEWAAKAGENEYAEPALNPCQTTAYAFFTGDQSGGDCRSRTALRPGSRRGVTDLPGFPRPGQEFVQARGRMVRQPLQDVSQPGVRVDVIELGRLDQGVERRRTPPTRVRAGEGPVSPSDGNAPNGPFSRIVGQANAPVLKKA